jgi:hypothetical protein
LSAHHEFIDRKGVSTPTGPPTYVQVLACNETKI